MPHSSPSFCRSSVPALALAAASMPWVASPAAAVTIDLGGDSTRGTSVSIAAGAGVVNRGNTAVQVFDLSGVDGSETQLDSFTFEADATVGRFTDIFFNTRVLTAPVLGGYLAELNDAAQTARIVGSAVPQLNSSTDGYELLRFVVRDPDGARVELDPALRYAAFITGNGLNVTNSGAGYSTRIATVSRNPPQFPTFTLDLPEDNLPVDNDVVQFLGNSGFGDADFAFTAVLVPEPASMALASAGALLLLRRRA